MRLFIDDIRKVPDNTWNVARSVGEAIRALSVLDIKEVSLDHDISHLITMEGSHRPYPCNETFEPVAHYLALMARLWTFTSGDKDHKVLPLKITIHTSNPTGGMRMQRILEEAGLKPTMKIGGLEY